MVGLAIFVIACALTLLAPAFSARRLSASRPEWGRSKVLAISALPLPLVNLAICIFEFNRLSNIPAEQCGVDACAMAAMGIAFLGLIAVVVCGPAGLLGAYFATASSYKNDIYK